MSSSAISPRAISAVVSSREMGRALLAEFLATLLLVLVGCGSVLAAGLARLPAAEGTSGDNNAKLESPKDLFTVAQTVQVALAFGLIVASMAQAIGHVSGCHVNPSVTLGLLVMGKVGILRAFLYVIAQCVGAIVGAAILKGLTPATAGGTLGTPALGNEITVGQGVGVELLITFILVLVVCGVTDDGRSDLKGSAALAVGLAITSGHLLAVNYTGSAMNPARAFGPAVISGHWNDHWVYWVGPLLGGLIAGIMYRFLFRQTENILVSAITSPHLEMEGEQKGPSANVFITNVG